MMSVWTIYYAEDAPSLRIRWPPGFSSLQRGWKDGPRASRTSPFKPKPGLSGPPAVISSADRRSDRQTVDFRLPVSPPSCKTRSPQTCVICWDSYGHGQHRVMKPWLYPLLLAVLASRGLASSVAITTTSVPNGTVNTSYSAVIKASGGCTPYKWALASGALPAGVTAKVSSTTTSVRIAGTPTKAAIYSFTEKVTGCGGVVSKASYRVTIQATANHVVGLNWIASKSTDVVGYNVYRSLDGATWKKINVSTVASTLYDDATVANNTTYYYAATAVDMYGRESGKTASIRAIVP